MNFATNVGWRVVDNCAWKWLPRSHWRLNNIFLSYIYLEKMQRSPSANYDLRYTFLIPYILVFIRCREVRSVNFLNSIILTERDQELRGSQNTLNASKKYGVQKHFWTVALEQAEGSFLQCFSCENQMCSNERDKKKSLGFTCYLVKSLIWRIILLKPIMCIIW